VLYTDDPSCDDRIKEDCVPGAPHVTFYHQPGVPVQFVNPQAHNGLFEVQLSVREGDTPAKLAVRLLKHHKQIKSMA